MTKIVHILDKYMRMSEKDRGDVEQWASGVETDGLTLRENITANGRMMGMSDGNVQIDLADGITLFNPDTGNRSIFLNPSGDAFFGSNIDAPSQTSLAIFAQDYEYNQNDYGAGDLLIGDDSLSMANMLWDYSLGQLRFRSGIIDSIIFDTDGTLRSGNYSSGVTGWKISGVGDAEFNDITARGAIKASVFNINEITATAGTFGVFKSAGVVYEDFYAPKKSVAVYILAKNSNVLSTAALFAQYDVIRIKSWNGSEVVDYWGVIKSLTAYTGYTQYLVQSLAGGDIAGKLIPKGTAIVDYGNYLGGDGYIMQTSDDGFGFGPNISLATFEGSGEVLTIAWGTGGADYAVDDILNVVDSIGIGTGCTIKVLAVDGSGWVLESGGFQTTPVTPGIGYGLATGEYELTPVTGVGYDARVSITSYTIPSSHMTLMSRIGNMRDSYGTGSNDRFGMGVGDFATGNYLSYNAQTVDLFELHAGDGGVLIGKDGIEIEAAGADAWQNKVGIRWSETIGGAANLRIWGYHSVSENTWGYYEVVDKGTGGAGGNSVGIKIQADGGYLKSGDVYIRASSDNLDNTSTLRLHNNDAGDDYGQLATNGWLELYGGLGIEVDIGGLYVGDSRPVSIPRGDADVQNDLTAGTIQADNGYTGTWVNNEAKTVTVVGGVITSVV